MSPIPALEVNNIVLIGKIRADELLNPISVIFRRLENKYLWLPTSVGVNQFISPSQKSGLNVLGVPPPTM